MKPHHIAIAAAFGLSLAGAAGAQEAPPQTEAAPAAAAQSDGPIRAQDTSLTCVQIGDEAARLSELIGSEPGDSIFSRLGGVARSGAAMLIPGAGLVIAGADALTQPERDRRQAEVLAVHNRWYYLNGLYSGRRCHEQAEAAEASAEAAATVTPQPSTSATEPGRQ